MKKRGFTLIELLAVIIILAIIALIATPIIMRVIENSKKAAAERSAENYVRAVETQALALKANGTTLEDGTYGINSNGNLCPNNATSCGEDKEIKIEMKGTKPSNGSIVISNEKVQSTGTKIKIGNYKTIIASDGKVVAYIQVYNPQYYTVGSGNIGNNAPVNSSDVAPTDRDIYLGYDVTDGKVGAAYVCFRNNDIEYCLKTSDKSAYDTNTQILDDAFKKSCSVMGDFYNCNIGNFSARAGKNGQVDSHANSAYCLGNAYGNYYCYGF